MRALTALRNGGLRVLTAAMASVTAVCWVVMLAVSRAASAGSYCGPKPMQNWMSWA